MLNLTTYQSETAKTASEAFRQAEELSSRLSMELVTRAQYFEAWTLIESNLNALEGVSI